jgi:endonuclease YncB( thermonuclease family)
MVRQGVAWAFMRYCHDPELYRLEKDAREAHTGLWALPEAQRVVPWEWRHHARETR